MHWTVCLDLEVECQKKPVVWRLKADEDWSGLNIHTAIGILELMDDNFCGKHTLLYLIILYYFTL